MKKGLIDLPNEVIAKISEHLKNKDLIRLSNTCKHIHDSINYFGIIDKRKEYEQRKEAFLNETLLIVNRDENINNTLNENVLDNNTLDENDFEKLLEIAVKYSDVVNKEKDLKRTYKNKVYEFYTYDSSKAQDYSMKIFGKPIEIPEQISIFDFLELYDENCEYEENGGYYSDYDSRYEDGPI